MSFAWNLRTLRSQKDLTQGELAEKIGVSQKTMSSWETGRTEPNVGEVIKLCEALGCTIEKITGIRAYNFNDITPQDVFERARTLPEHDLMYLEKIVKETLHIRRQQEELERERRRQQEKLEEERRAYKEKIAEYEAEICELRKKMGDIQ